MRRCKVALARKENKPAVLQNISVRTRTRELCEVYTEVPHGLVRWITLVLGGDALCNSLLLNYIWNGSTTKT
jgi:hypothetical protein